MPLHWWEQQSIIDSETAKVGQKGKVALDYLEQQQRQREASWIGKQQAKEAREREMWESINRQRRQAQAVQDLRNASHALEMAGFGFNPIPITPQTIEAQIHSGFTMAGQLVKQGELETLRAEAEAKAKRQEELRKEAEKGRGELRKEAEQWAKWHAAQKEVKWSDYNPAEQEIMIDIMYQQLQGGQKPIFTEEPKPVPKWYELWKKERWQPYPWTKEGAQVFGETIYPKIIQPAYRYTLEGWAMLVNYADLLLRKGEENWTPEEAEFIRQMKKYRETGSRERKLPPKELFESYEKLGTARKLAGELTYPPLWLLPGATQAKAALKPAMAAGGARGAAAKAAGAGLTPLVGVEWAIGQVINLPIKLGVAGTDKLLTMILTKNAQKLAIIARREPLNATDKLLKHILEWHKYYLSMKVDNILKAQAAARPAKGATKVSVEQAIKKEILLLDSGARTTGQTVNNITKFIKSGRELTPESLPALIAKDTPDNFVKGISDIISKPIITKAAGEVAKEVTPAVKPIISEAVKSTAEVGPITSPQIEEIMKVSKAKLLITEADKTIPQFRRFAKAMTGKAKIREMTEGEAKFLIEGLEALPMGKAGKPPRIPTTTAVITKEFAEKIPLLQECGILERFRPARAVYEKMGLYHEVYEPSFFTEVLLNEERMAFEKELKRVAKLVPPKRREAVFDAVENPTQKIDLNSKEQEAAIWLRKYFDDWADKLNLPAAKRREHYITHIFEEDMMQQLKAKHPLDIELLRALDFFTPKTVFMPYLEARLGQKVGLIRDPFRAAGAYEARALKKYYYEPLIKRIRVYEKYLPPNSARQLREYVTRITGRPIPVDREVNESLRQIAGAIAKLPLGKELAKILTTGNVSGLTAYHFTGAVYYAWLGWRPASALKNLSQHGLILAEVGPSNLTQGMRLAHIQEGKEALKHSMVLRSRPFGYLPGVDTAFLGHFTGIARSKGMVMFRGADRKNVIDAFLSGYAEAKAKGLPYEWCIKRGDEIAERTQYIYTKLGGAMWMQSAPGRVLGILTTWPVNWAELMIRWMRGTPARVYADYAKAMGKALPKPRPIFNKSFLTYSALVAALWGVQRNTRIKATYYSGIRSLETFADMFSGNFPGLEWPGGIANIIAGAFLLDKTRIKRGWAKIDPQRTFAIVKQIKDIASGDRDWLSLFVYENQEYIKDTRRKARQKEQRELAKITLLNIVAQMHYAKNWDELTEEEEAEIYRLHPDL